MPIVFTAVLIFSLLIGLPAAKAQTEDEIPFESRWYIGPTYQMDNITLPTDSTVASDQLMGLTGFHRMNPYFGTGASLFFTPQDSSIALQLNSRWIWPLPIVEPYVGANLHYLSRDGGGLSIVFQPGLQIQALPFPLLFDIYALARYDIVSAVFNNQYQQAARFGLGASVLFQL